jgi:hypothetical protein
LLIIFRNPAALVTIIVEESDTEAEKFSVHKDFACFYSPVFKAAFNSTFVEGETQTYTLQDTTKEAVRALLHWFYTLKLDNIYEEEITRDPPKAKVKSETTVLVELWVLADRLLVRRLQNEIIERLEELRKLRNEVPTSTFDLVYKKTSEGSPLRKLMLHYSASYLINGCFQKRPDYISKSMLIDLVELMKSSIPSQTRQLCINVQDLSLFKVSEDET